MKPPRNPRYLAWIRTQPCCVCGSTQRIEASHTGPHGIGQKSPDSSAIPLCAKHHRTGPDSYHRLGPRKFSKTHNLDIPAIVRRLNLKPMIRVEAGLFVTCLEDRRFAMEHPELEAITHNLSITTMRYIPLELRASVGSEQGEAYLNRLNQLLLTYLENSGEAFASNAEINGKYALRFCIVNFRTSTDDIEDMPQLVACLGGQAHADLNGR